MTIAISGGNATAQAGPRAIDHRWGATLVAAPPDRSVSLSFTGIDAFLALGIVPTAYRAWYGGDARGLWPWSAARMAPDATPVVLRGEIDAETVARLEPDFVEATYSGISRAQYAALSRVAPVLPARTGSGDFGATWEEMLTGIGEATGRAKKAEEVIADIEGRISSIRAAHRDWDGQTAIVALPSGPTIFGQSDPRMLLLTKLGFRLPETAGKLSLGAFSFKLDPELTAPLEADVVIWLDFGSGFDTVRDNPLRGGLRIVRDGREIAADQTLSAALSYASPLSIPYALDRLVPLLEVALDGDPETVVTGAREAGLVR
ncbi:MAG: ABC transporter substrate-binding protein [Pseudomonadota bacterium]